MKTSTEKLKEIEKEIEEEDFMTIKEGDICTRCKKNKATLVYTNSQMDFIHGFTEKICQECYDKQMKESDWYKQGIQSERARIKEEIEKFDFAQYSDMGMADGNQKLLKQELLKVIEEK